MSPHQPQKNPFVARFQRTYEAACLRTKQPTTVAEGQVVNAWFRHHSNEQRPHQGLSCGNQPPGVAFPNLPPLPALPATVDPDAWLAHTRGRAYRRHISSQGTLQLGRHPYDVGTEYSGQQVALIVRPAGQIVDVLLGQTVLKSLAIKGLANQKLALAAYLHHIGQEAESEYRQYLASQKRYVQVGAM